MEAPAFTSCESKVLARLSQTPLAIALSSKSERHQVVKRVKQTGDFETVVGPGDRFLRISEVEKRTGLTRGVIYYLIGQDEFPAQIPLGKRVVAWSEAEIEAWMLACRANRRKPKAPRRQAKAEERQAAA
jgi:prophage regulatory protein